MSLHPLVQKELDNVSGAECPFCAVMGRINWKILHQVSLNQSAACDHCRDAPEIISFLHDFITVHKKHGEPFDKNNFEKYAKIIASLAPGGIFHPRLYITKHDVFTHIEGPGPIQHTHKSDFKTKVELATKCSPGSTRDQKMGENHIMTLCCPAGSWNGKKCSDIEIVKSITHMHEKKLDDISEFIESNFSRMAHAILLTDKHNVEHGFCGNSTVVGGKETDLSLPYCPEKLHFHTHNSGAMYPSNTDFQSSSSQNAIAECIGTHEGIACYHPKSQEQIYKS